MYLFTATSLNPDDARLFNLNVCKLNSSSATEGPGHLTAHGRTLILLFK